MTKEEFTQIEQSWTSFYEQAKSHFENIKSSEDLLNLPVNQLRELITYSKKYLADLELLFTDFRHLIGMINFSAVNQRKLVTLFKNITCFRPDAKRIARINTLDFVCTIPFTTEYDLKLTPGLKITADLRPGQKLTGDMINQEAETEIKYFPDCVISRFKDGRITIVFSRDNALAVRQRLVKATNQKKVSPDQNLGYFITKLESGFAYGFPVEYFAKTDSFSIIIKPEFGTKQPIYDFFAKLLDEGNQKEEVNV